MNKIYITLLAFCFFCSCNRVSNNDTDKNMIASCDTIYTEPKEEIKTLTIDSLKAESSLIYSESSKWVEPKNTENTIYCYFQIEKGKAHNPRLRIEYIEGTLKDATSYEIIADTVAFKYAPNKNMTSNHNSKFNWYDKDLNLYDVELIKSLAQADSAKIIIKYGSNNKKAILPISKKTRQDLKLMYDYYRGLGGGTIPEKGKVVISY